MGMLLSSKGYLSHLSDGTKGVTRGRRYTAPVGSGTTGPNTAAAPVGGKDSSVTSVTVKRAYLGGGYIPPVGSGTPGHHTTAATGGGKDSSVTSVTV
jgi:hypothetical protein